MYISAILQVCYSFSGNISFFILKEQKLLFSLDNLVKEKYIC